MIEHAVYKFGLRDENSPFALGRMIMDINEWIEGHPRSGLSVDSKAIQSVGIGDHICAFTDGSQRELTNEEVHQLFQALLPLKYK